MPGGISGPWTSAPTCIPRLISRCDSLFSAGGSLGQIVGGSWFLLGRRKMSGAHQYLSGAHLRHSSALVTHVYLTASKTMPHESAPQDRLPHGDVPRISNPLEQEEFLHIHSSRYRVAGRDEKGRIIDEFVSRTGYHRKHATRLLRSGPVGPRQPFYDKVVRDAAIVAWEAAGRPGSRRLKALLPELVPTMVKRGELPRDLALRGKLQAASAATLDRLVAPARSKVRVALLEERLGQFSEVARDFADFHIPEDLSEQERQHLESRLIDLLGLIRQTVSAEVQPAITSDYVVASDVADGPERVT